MSDAEALMWNLEKDPLLRASFANVTMLDRPASEQRLRDRMALVVEAFPRLRRRVVPTFGRLAPPRWVDDPDFDPSYHIRRVAVPGRGTDRDLFDLAARLIEDPFDRSRPLWRFWVVEGLSRRRGAIVQQLHHTITDGEGGVRLSAMMLDLERDATEPMIPVRPVEDDEPDAPGRAGPVAGLMNAVDHNARRQLGLARRAVGGAIGSVRHPAQLPATATKVARAGRSLARQAVVTEQAHSPLWTERSLGRRLEALRVPLDDARRAAKALGGTVNDYFVTASAAGAGEYHRQMGAPVDELRVSMPVSVRSEKKAGGNAFSPARLLVPTGTMAAADRFAEVHERLHAAKSEPALKMVEGLAGVLNLLPTSLLVEVGRRQVATVDFAVSNVRGAPFDLYLAGAKVVANYPVGPTGGTAFNLTLLSSGGMLDMGLNVDTGAVAEPARLKRCLDAAFAELNEAGTNGATASD